MAESAALPAEPEPGGVVIVGPWAGLEPPAEAPAVCSCGNGTERGHGAIDGRRPFSCDEVLAIRACVQEYAAWRPWWRRWGRQGARA